MDEIVRQENVDEEGCRITIGPLLDSIINRQLVQNRLAKEEERAKRHVFHRRMCVIFGT